MKESMQPNSLINAPLQRRGAADVEDLNRFSGFLVVAESHTRSETAKAVDPHIPWPATSLKRGVNEKGSA